MGKLWRKGIPLILFCLVNSIVWSATEVVKIVDPDNGPGTDYTSLSAWEAGEQKNLVDNNEIAIAKCRNTAGSADTSGVTISGWTTDADHYIKITVESGYRHDGTEGTGYRIAPSSSTDYGIEIEEDYTQVEWVAIDQTNITVAGIHCYGLTDGTGITIHHVLMYNIQGGDIGVYNRSAADVSVYRCIAYQDSDAGSGYGFGQNNSDGSMHCRNCTAKVNYVAYRNAAGSMTTDNCFGGASYPWYGSFSGNYNCDTTSNSTYQAPGANSLHDKNASDQFESITDNSQDFHLKSGADCIDAGNNLGSPYDYDIDNQQVTGTWDIGADEYVAAAAPTKVQVIIISKNNLGRR